MSPEDNSSVAVATPQAVTKPEDPNLRTEVITIAGRGEVERLTARITLPVDYQYGIPKWQKTGRQKPDGKDEWGEVIDSVGITADGYEYLNRVIGVRFFFPPLVPNREGVMVPNPIIEPPDYSRILQGALWYNPMGQHMVSYELVEVDFWLMYQEARAGKKSAKIVTDPETFQPTFDKRGMANLELPEADELAAYKDLAQRRSLGPRYAQTVARVRLLKQASGLRSLPLPPDGKLHAYPLTVTGFRDQLDAREAIKAAVGAEASFYGEMEGRSEVAPVSASELAEAHLDHEADEARVVEHMERESVEEARTPAEAKAEPPAGTPPAEGLQAAPAAICGHVSVDELTKGSVCQMAPNHGGVMHRDKDGSWPMAK